MRFRRPGESRRARFRAAQVLASAAERVAPPLFGAWVSLEAIRRASVGTWGEVVEVMLVVQLAASVVGWGNREILLREFSQTPARIGAAWRSSLATRLTLFPLALAVALFLPWSPLALAAGSFWCLGLIGVQSMESLIVYRRDFRFAAMMEALGGLTVVVAIRWSEPAPSAEQIVTWLALATWFKLGALLLRHRRSTFGGAWLDPLFFRRALPFFLLGVTGLLQSRADLYAAAWVLPSEDLGQYQVLLNMLVLLQSGSAFLLAPWTRTLYRVRHGVVVRISRRLLVAGVAVVGIGLLAIDLTLEHLYRMPMASWVLGLGGLMILPSYYYVPSIYELFRHSRQSTVVWVNLVAAVASFGASLLLLALLGLPGALLAAAVAQWTMLCAYVSLADSASRHGTALPRLR